MLDRSIIEGDVDFVMLICVPNFISVSVQKKKIEQKELVEVDWQTDKKTAAINAHPYWNGGRKVSPG